MKAFIEWCVAIPSAVALTLCTTMYTAGVITYHAVLYFVDIVKGGFK